MQNKKVRKIDMSCRRFVMNRRFFLFKSCLWDDPFAYVLIDKAESVAVAVQLDIVAAVAL